MRKYLMAALVCLLFIQQPLKSQYYYYNNKYYDNPLVFEVGVTGGVMNSFTDLGGKKGVGKNFIKDLRWKTARPSYGLYVAANYQDALFVRLEGTFGQVTGADSILKNVAASTYGRYERNLSFKSKISEAQLSVEVHPLFFKPYEDGNPPRLSPYAVAGVGLFSFDPQTKFNGQWYALKPLRTEGQGFAEYPETKEYSLTQLNFLAGAGLKYEISPFINARLEFVHRFLRTDYLDDVSGNYIDPSLFANYLTPNQASIAQQLYYRRDEIVPSDVSPLDSQRGDPKDKDAYFTIQFKIGMTLGRQKIR